MEEEKNTQGTGLAIGALVTGILAFLIAVVPCIGIIAFIPAVIAIILAIVGLSRPNKNQGMLIGGLAVAIIAIMFAVAQSFILKKVGDNSDRWVPDIEKAVREITDDIEKEFGDNDVTIRIRHNNDSVEINATTRRGDLEDKLDELEGTEDTVKTEPEK